MLAWSIRQFLVTQKIAKSEFELWVKFLSRAMILSKSLLEQGWPMMHGFFIIMGGFHPFEHSFMGADYYNKAMLYCMTTMTLSIHLLLATSLRMMCTNQSGQTSTSPHLQYQPRKKSRTRERVTGLLNPLSCSKHCGL